MTKPITKFRGEYRFLSNFWPVEDGITAEHLYMAEKTDRPEEKAAIMACVTPGAAKRLSKMVHLRADWPEVRIDKMREVLRWKFNHKHLADMLLATSDAELIEGNTWHDYFWGVCNGKGENNLGKLLMEIRTELGSK